MRTPRKIKNARKYKRLKAYYLVQYEVDSKGSKPKINNVRDISAGGLKFISDEAVPERAGIKLRVLMPSLEKTLVARAQILRVRRVPHAVNYTVAVKFTEISQDDQKALNDFIERLAEDRNARFLIDHAEVVVRKG